MKAIMWVVHGQPLSSFGYCENLNGFGKRPSVRNALLLSFGTNKDIVKIYSAPRKVFDTIKESRLSKGELTILLSESANFEYEFNSSEIPAMETELISDYLSIEKYDEERVFPPKIALPQRLKTVQSVNDIYNW
jgi:hypothetical protein